MSIESMAIVLHHSRATGSAKLIALGIANHDGDGGAWPSIATLARYANISDRAVQAAIGQLVALGEVVVKRQAGGPAEYANNRRPNLYELRVCCPTDCDRSKHHRTRRTATTLPLPLGEADITPEPWGEADSTSRGEADDTSRGEADDPLTIHRNHPENAGALEGASTTDRASAEAPPASESLAAIRSILSARSHAS